MCKSSNTAKYGRDNNLLHPNGNTSSFALGTVCSIAEPSEIYAEKRFLESSAPNLSILN